MSTEPPPSPGYRRLVPGELVCPQCATLIGPKLRQCPGCGLKIPRRRYWGLWVLLGGLGLTVLGGGGAFFACLAAIGTPSSRGAESWFFLSLGAAGFGLLAMFVGFIITLIQAVRKDRY